MRKMRLVNKILSTLIKDRLYHPNRLIADTFTILARCGVLLLLYAYVFKLRGGEVNGVTYSLVAWSMFFYFAFSTLRLRGISKLIMEDVRSGNVEMLFNKPISYLSYRMWWQIGIGLYPFFVTAILGAVILTFTAGIPATMKIPIFYPSLILTLIGATILSLVLYSIIGLISFWIEEVNPIFWIVDKTVMILGGSYLPIALFPDLMYKVAVFSPFGASQFVTHTVQETWQFNWYLLIGVQLFWILLLSIICYVMFVRARYKVSVNGG